MAMDMSMSVYRCCGNFQSPGDREKWQQYFHRAVEGKGWEGWVTWGTRTSRPCRGSSWTPWTQWTCWTPWKCWTHQWGGHLHQVGEELLPTCGGNHVSLLWHHWRYLVQPRRRWSQLPVYASGPTIQPLTHIQKWSKQSGQCVWVRVRESRPRNTQPQCTLCCVSRVHSTNCDDDPS